MEGGGIMRIITTVEIDNGEVKNIKQIMKDYAYREQKEAQGVSTCEPKTEKIVEMIQFVATIAQAAFDRGCNPTKKDN
jgi:hypothetical protein